MSFQVIVTLGPSILQRATLREIDALGPCIYRINGAHVAPTEVTRVAAQVRDILGAEARVMIDLPGNKVRTANLSTPLRLVAGSLVELADWQVNLRTFHEYVQPGDTIYANDSTYRLTVERIEGSTIVLRSHSDGLLQTNKGLHLPGITERLPFLFDRDRALMDAACACDLTYVSLSFVRTAADVREARAVLAARTATPPALIAKIETAP
ncbi:MAG: pyruvate kinase, partial [Gemmatimonadaceae bacterium]|nr:pyruvate kinase [Gemmatimonadaceae bacterium]